MTLPTAITIPSSAARGKARQWPKLLLAAVLFGGLGTAGAFAQARGRDSVSVPPEVRWRAAFRGATGRQTQEDFRDLMLAEADSTSILSQSYLAVGQLLVGAHRRSVFAKWRSFRTWTSALDKLIESAPENPELRFLRVTVQSNAPGFLGYSGALREDCPLVLAAVDQGHWDDDPDHAEFVQTTTSRLPECQILH